MLLLASRDFELGCGDFAILPTSACRYLFQSGFLLRRRRKAERSEKRVHLLPDVDSSNHKKSPTRHVQLAVGRSREAGKNRLGEEAAPWRADVGVAALSDSHHAFPWRRDGFPRLGVHISEP